MSDAEQEIQLEKNPEASYDSRKFIAMIRDPQLFRQQLPSVVREVKDSQPLQLDGEAARVQQQMYDATNKLWQEGSNHLLMSVYGKYAREKGLRVVRSTQFGQVDTPKAIEELSPDEAGEWQTYLDTTDLPRQDALDAVKNLGFDLPSVRRIDDKNIQFLHSRLESVPYQLALAVLPDISDEEAKELFDQNTDAETVRRLSVDPIEKSNPEE